MRRILCSVHGARYVPDIAPIGPTMTRPAMPFIDRLIWTKPLYDGDAACNHYVTYALGGGVRCIRCRGWYCA